MPEQGYRRENAMPIRFRLLAAATLSVCGVAEAAFPEYELIATLLVAESDLVAARCTFRGVHKGEFAGIQPTGKRVSTDLMIFYRIREGKISEHWMQMDTRGLMDQLTK